MSDQQKKSVMLQRSLIAAGVAVALVLPVANASAASFFEMLFGGVSRAVPSAPPAALPAVRPSGDPSALDDRRNSGGGGGGGGGPSTAYCVRLCDGQPIPVQTTNSSPTQACASMCPAAKTKIFTGSGIDHATSSDGKRYADLPTAYSYRKKLSPDCTCNGKRPVGLVTGDARHDQTLRPGDMVATNQGLVMYRGQGSRGAEFSPVKDKKLATIQIRPAPPAASAAALSANARAETPRSGEEPASREGRRRAHSR